jgi:MazG family protein
MTEFERLRAIVARLRAEDGCPWDRQQTHESLKPEIIEEACEVVCGINILEKEGNADNLKEELGDLLLQVVFHAQLAEEEGLFTMDDVLAAISEKMIRRHPHVFGNAENPAPGTEHAVWEQIKKAEKKDKTLENKYLPGAFEEGIALVRQAQKRKEFI